jgi:hypothetical protein
MSPIVGPLFFLDSQRDLKPKDPEEQLMLEFQTGPRRGGQEELDRFWLSDVTRLDLGLRRIRRGWTQGDWERLGDGRTHYCLFASVEGHRGALVFIALALGITPGSFLWRTRVIVWNESSKRRQREVEEVMEKALALARMGGCAIPAIDELDLRRAPRVVPDVFPAEWNAAPSVHPALTMKQPSAPSPFHGSSAA